MSRMPLFALALCLALAPGPAGAARVIRGHVLGHDGRPLPKAIVRELERTGPVRSKPAGPDGSFEVTLDSLRTDALWMLGPHHEDATIPVTFAGADTLELEVRLAPLRYARRLDSVRVIGEFNEYDEKRALPMVRRSDGTFAVRIPWDRDTLRYQLLGITEDGRPAAGTDADTFFVRQTWISAVWGRGREVEIRFDPRRLARSRAEAVVRFPRGPADGTEIYRCFYEEERHGERFGRAYRAFLAGGGEPDSFRFDRKPRRRELLRRLENTRLPRVRQYLMLQYMDQLAEAGDSAFARRTLEQVPPDALAWSLVGFPWQVLHNAGRLLDDDTLVSAYASRVADVNPDPRVRASVLSQLIRDADADRDTARVAALLGRLLREHPASREARDASKQFSPDRAIRIGAMAPDAEVPALEDSTLTVRLADFRGRHVLVDFWATWCGPCLVEMRHLHAAWEKFRGRGLAILSISFDMRRDAAIRYRAGRWNMPWDHAFAPGAFDHEIARRFEVTAIPRAVLIGPDGRIVAADAPLRGERLLETLEELLGAGNSRGTGR